MEQFVGEFFALAGYAALVSLIIGILKTVGVVKDGTSDKWAAGFNLAGLLAFVVVRQFFPQVDVAPIDSALGQFAALGAYVLSYVVMLLGSKVTYSAVRGLPVVGKTFTSEVDDAG